MNSEELQLFLKMSAREVIAKYKNRTYFKEIFSVWEKGQNAPEQKSLLEEKKEEVVSMSQNEIKTPEIATSGATTHNNPIEGKTQKQKLLNLLSDNEWHDTVEILNKVYKLDDKGIARIGARIHDLKKDGVGIESRKKNKTIWEYKITPCG